MGWGDDVRHAPADAGEQVARLPRRTAHAVHALIACSADLHGPPVVSEVAIFDQEAPSTRGTGAALREAARRGLAVYAGDGVWTPTLLAMDFRTALEDRFLADTEQP